MAIQRPLLPPVPGYVEIGEDGILPHYYLRVADGRVFDSDLQPLIPFTPSELRKNAYETLPIVTYEDETMTVDAAEKLFLQYLPEDSERCDVLKGLIKAAKQQIREMYPDEE